MIKYFSSTTIGKWIDWQEHTRRPQYLNNDPRYIEACVAYLDKKNAEENSKLKPKESLRSLEIAKAKKVRTNRSLLFTHDPFDAVQRLMPDLSLLKRSYLDSLLSC